MYAPINAKPAGGGRQGMGWGFDIFQKLQSNSLPTGKSLQTNATKFSPRRAAHCCQISQGRTQLTQERHSKNYLK